VLSDRLDEAESRLRRELLLLVDSESAAVGILPSLSTAGHGRRPHVAVLTRERSDLLSAPSGSLPYSIANTVSMY
jgi:hypothetical protein